MKCDHCYWLAVSADGRTSQCLYGTTWCHMYVGDPVVMGSPEAVERLEESQGACGYCGHPSALRDEHGDCLACGSS